MKNNTYRNKTEAEGYKERLKPYVEIIKTFGDRGKLYWLTVLIRLEEISEREAGYILTQVKG